MQLMHMSHFLSKKKDAGQKPEDVYPESQKAGSMSRRQPTFTSAVIHDSLACLHVQLSDIDIPCGISASVALGKKDC